jgi:S-disulfanyl-L-cysteine oxidoreductase SoxD
MRGRGVANQSESAGACLIRSDRVGDWKPAIAVNSLPPCGGGPGRGVAANAALSESERPSRAAPLPNLPHKGGGDGRRSITPKSSAIIFSLAALAATALASACLAGEPYGLGRTATPQEIAGWDIDISPDGAGLPPGHGDVARGRAIYNDKCAACHGAKGEGKPMDALAGGFGAAYDKDGKRTVGSYWPYATTLFDFVRRAMPFNAPQSLTPDEVYAVSAYVLYLNGLVAEDATLDAKSLPKIEMPNRSHFISAFRPTLGGAAK